MRVTIVSGLSGSGKSVALNVLEDLGFYCIDNIPARLLSSFLEDVISNEELAYDEVGLGLDARNRPDDLTKIPELVADLRARNVACDVVFLQAEDDILLTRFSETRRRHPLTREGISLSEAIAHERNLLSPIINTAELIVDTSHTTVYELRDMIRKRVGTGGNKGLSILIESFGYKHGLPADADFVFDVRCLPNPYWEPRLRPLNGTDSEVADFLADQPSVGEMIEDIVNFLDRWIPRYRNFQRSYLTVAVGCTGGQHRSVYVTEQVADRLTANYGSILTRHTELRNARQQD
jgi:UPF0042 nucleotide-binding protein